MVTLAGAVAMAAMVVVGVVVGGSMWRRRRRVEGITPEEFRRALDAMAPGERRGSGRAARPPELDTK